MGSTCDDVHAPARRAPGGADGGADSRFWKVLNYRGDALDASRRRRRGGAPLATPRIRPGACAPGTSSPPPVGHRHRARPRTPRGAGTDRVEWDVADLVLGRVWSPWPDRPKGSATATAVIPGADFSSPSPSPSPSPSLSLRRRLESTAHGTTPSGAAARAPADDFAVTRRPPTGSMRSRAAQREVPGPRAPGRELLRAHGAPRVAELEDIDAFAIVSHAPRSSTALNRDCWRPRWTASRPMTTRVAASPRAAGRPAAVAGGALRRDGGPGRSGRATRRAGAASPRPPVLEERPPPPPLPPRPGVPSRPPPRDPPRGAARGQPAHHRTRRHRVKVSGVRRRLERRAATPSRARGRPPVAIFYFQTKRRRPAPSFYERGTAHEGATIHRLVVGHARERRELIAGSVMDADRAANPPHRCRV